MGVPLLLTWLRKRFSCCFLPADTAGHHNARGSDNLYIDLNSLLYQSAAIVSAGGSSFRTAEDVEDAVLHKLFHLLDDIVFNLVEPRALVYIAVDGVSPLGKMAQQRARRRRQGGGRSRYQRPSTDHSCSTESLWDNNCISVGTRFMAKATQALHYYAASRTERTNLRRFQEARSAVGARVPSPESATASEHESPFTPISIVVDDVLRPGEGENKISEAIRQFRLHPGYNPNTSHVICSSDTDVTVCSLILHEPRIHVLRYEPPTTVGGKDASTDHRHGTDSWMSTFFSIHLFREQLRTLLGLADETVMAGSSSANRSDTFERALHDVVFVLLLFGNDFLPSLGGRINEGTLDSLLTLLASDFVSRGRTVVDPITNHLHFASARYLLDCLSDIRAEQGNGDGNLQVYSSGKDSNWGFDDDKAHQSWKLKREKQMERKCYCYWTMMQWALQYSVGVVDHWGCYYPYSDAPPLHMLRKYCGVLPYGSLIRLAAMKAKHRMGDDDVLDDKLSGIEITGDHNADDMKHNRGKPTDVLVQLLVLLPKRCTGLFPTVIRQHYAEIESLVQAPVEQLDLLAIEQWCEDKKRHLSEEERIRYRAYQIFSVDTPLSAAQGTCQNDPPEMYANTVAFMATWPQLQCQAELQALARASASHTSAEAVAPAVSLVSQGSKSFDYFSAKGRPRGSAAAALLNTAPKPTISDVNVLVDGAVVDCAPVEEVPLAATGERVSTFTEHAGRFIFVTAPLSLLQDAGLQQAMGVIQGNRFVVGSYNPNKDGGMILSRDTQTLRVRIQWSMVAAPAVRDNSLAASLLPGYITPVERTFAEQLKESTHSPSEPDPWKAMEKAKQMQSKRPRPDLEDGGNGVPVPMNHETSEDTAFSSLEIRKMEVRKRLEALKSAKRIE